MIDEEMHIKELYDLKHFQDNNLHTHYDYEETFLNKTMSNVMLGNEMTETFIKKQQKLMVLMMESPLIIKNWYNFSVDKYYNKHNR